MVLHEPLQTLSEVSQCRCRGTHVLEIFDLVIIIQRSDDHALVFLKLREMLYDALIELPILHVFYIGQLDLLDLLVLQVPAAELALVLREIEDLLVRPETVF